MMRLQVLHNAGFWKVLALLDDNDYCEVEDAINALANDRTTRATAAGFLAHWAAMNRFGPRSLGTDKYHRVDDRNQINEFIKRDHRILCFEAEGAVVVCSHVILKQGRKTPATETEKAVELKRRYLEAAAQNELKIVTRGMP